MSNSKRKCIHCKDYKPALNGLQTPVGYFCSYEHAQAYSLSKTAHKRTKEAREQKKKERQERKARKEKLKDRKWYEKKAQKVFNAWIRERDKDQPCISCQIYKNSKINAGHYRTTKAAPHLRFNEGNCHLQCEQCNTYLSGNIGEYRINLIKKIGIEEVERIENDHTIKKWTIEELKEIINKYKMRCTVD